MPTNYPNALDDTTILKNDATNSTVSLNTHRTSHNNLADAIIAIETELGTNPRGSFASVVSRLNATVSKVPGSTQTISPSADIIPLALRAHSSQTRNLLEVRNDPSSYDFYYRRGELIRSQVFDHNALSLEYYRRSEPVYVLPQAGISTAWWTKDGVFNANSYSVSGAALASSHLADGGDILKNPSPSITTPTISSPTFTGTPTATTPPTDNNSTRVATTEFVINQGYAKPNSPAFTGNPTAPTAPQGTNTNQIATTAFVVNEILARQTSAIPTGAVMPFAGSSLPSGWLECDGSNVSKTTYADLYAVIGNTYGAGDENNFTLPDLRGRMVVGKGTHADVDALNDNEGVAVASRRPRHAATYSLSTNTDGGHQHSGVIHDVGNHNHTYTGTGNSTMALPGGVAAATAASGSTSTAGAHTHTISAREGGGHGHSVTGTIGLSGVTDSPAYITLKYAIKT